MKATRPDGPVRIEAVEFRWPIEQTSNHSVEVIIPLAPGEALVKLNHEACEKLNLSHTECDRVIEEAETAAIRSILIKK